MFTTRKQHPYEPTTKFTMQTLTLEQAVAAQTVSLHKRPYITEANENYNNNNNDK